MMIHGEAGEKPRKGWRDRGRRRPASPEYRAWGSMVQRCENPKALRFPYYGARGIRVCAAWRHDFAAFLRDVGRRPSPLHSLDRWPDNDGHYEPGNVRWATKLEQVMNRRRAAAHAAV